MEEPWIAGHAWARMKVGITATIAELLGLRIALVVVEDLMSCCEGGCAFVGQQLRGKQLEGDHGMRHTPACSFPRHEWAPAATRVARICARK